MLAENRAVAEHGSELGAPGFVFVFVLLDLLLLLHGGLLACIGRNVPAAVPPEADMRESTRHPLP